MNGVTLQTVLDLIPEMILMGTAVAVYILGAFIPAKRLWSGVAAIGLAAAAMVMWQRPDAASGFAGPIVRDALTTQFRWLTLILGFLFLLVTSKRTGGDLAAEFVGSLLLILSGMMLTAGAGDLLLVFLGLELVSIPTYILLYIGRKNRESQESAVKYFYLSIVSSAVLLYGFSFLFGVSGSTSLAEIHRALIATDGSASWLPLGGLAMVLIFAGLAFKIAAVPFHFYAPDVYEGTSNANAAILAVAPKIVGVIVLARIAVMAMPNLGEYGIRIAMILAVLTMTVGNVLALWQTNLRRLLAYSSIAHAGYMLVGLAVAFDVRWRILTNNDNQLESTGGLAPVLFYLVVYSLASIGAFACLSAASDEKHRLETTHNAAGLARRHPLVAGLLSLFLLTLAGIPPAMAGLFGKFTIFWDAMRLAQLQEYQSLFTVLAVIGMLNAVIAAGYYLRVIGSMYFRPADTVDRAAGETGAFMAAVVSCILLLAIGFVPGFVAQNSRDAADGAAVSFEQSLTAVSTPAEAAADLANSDSSDSLSNGVATR